MNSSELDLSSLAIKLQQRPIPFKEYVELCSRKVVGKANYSVKFLDSLAKALATAARGMLDVCEGDSIYDFGVTHPGIAERVTKLVDAEYFVVKHKYLDGPEIPSKVQLVDESEISDVKGVMISNKLFSMLPFHLIVRNDGEIKEVYVTHDGENFREVLKDLGEGEESKEIMEYLGKVEDPRSRLEISLEAVRMIKKMGEKLSSGFVVTSDYLLDPSELSEAERASGTITCYNETVHTHNPFLNPGRFMIRASVNLSALVEFGEEFGLKVVGLTNHVHLLKSTIGSVDELSPELDRISGSKYRYSKLGTVKILIQQKGLRNSILKFLRYVPQFGFWERYNLPNVDEVEILPEG